MGNVEAHTQFKYDYTFLDDDSDKGCFDLEKTYMADRFRDYGRCVVVMDARVYDIYGGEMHAYFEHHNLGLEVFPLGIDEQQKSLRTVEEVLVYVRLPTTLIGMIDASI